MRAHIGYSFGAVREARADRGARDVASRADQPRQAFERCLATLHGKELPQEIKGQLRTRGQMPIRLPTLTPECRPELINLALSRLAA